LLQAYPVVEVENAYFEFVTKGGIKYAAYFVDYGFMFSEYPEFSSNIYSFNIDVIETESDILALDERTGFTIFKIIEGFFKKIDNVVIYVCDNIDKRHLARKRKFDVWFLKYNDGTILKEDGIATIEGAEILNSILIHKNNPKRLKIISAFNQLNLNAGEK